MEDSKPSSIKFLYGLLIFRLFLITLLIIVFYFVKDLDPSENSFGTGIRQSIVDRLNIESNNTDYLFGYLIGKFSIPFFLNILALFFIKARKFWALLVTVIIDLLFGLPQGMPIIQIILLVLILINPGKSYLRKKQTGNE